MAGRIITPTLLLVALVALAAIVLWAELGFPGIQPWMYPVMALLLMAGIGVAAVRLA